MVMDLVMDAMDGPFVWGRSDCCTCACDVFRALHGIDPMASMRGRYTTKIGAYRLIKSQGGWMNMFEALAAQCGLGLATGHGLGWLGLARVGNDLALVIGVDHGLWAGKVDGGYQTVRNVVMSCHS